MHPLLKKYLDDEALSPQEAEALTQAYPYFVLPLIDSADNRRIRTRVACGLGRGAAENIFGHNADIFEDFYPEAAEPHLSTDEAIDYILERYPGQQEPLPAEAPAIYEIPEDAEPCGPIADDETSRAIDAFLAATPAPVAARRKAAEPQPDAGADLSESLAHAMIRNGNFRKALEIITAIRAENPQKSIYFADQMRFLRKLIINERNSNTTKYTD